MLRLEVLGQSVENHNTSLSKADPGRWLWSHQCVCVCARLDVFQRHVGLILQWLPEKDQHKHWRHRCPWEAFLGEHRFWSKSFWRCPMHCRSYFQYLGVTESNQKKHQHSTHQISMKFVGWKHDWDWFPPMKSCLRDWFPPRSRVAKEQQAVEAALQGPRPDWKVLRKGWTCS